MKTIQIKWLLLITCFVMIGSVQAQGKQEKLNERFNVNRDVTIEVDTRYADVIFETWSKDEVSVEAYVEGEDAKGAARDWDLTVSGNSDNIRISSKNGYSDAKVYNLDDLEGLEIDLGSIIGSSLSVVEPVLEGLVGPILEGLSGTPLPKEYYEEMGKIKFDHEAYKRDGKAYIKKWEKQMDRSFGPDFEKAMEKWEKEMDERSDQWSLNLGALKGIPRWPFKSGGNMSFNSDEYEKDKKGYVAKLNRKYGTTVSVREVDAWLEDMEEWGDKFGEDMEEWGEDFGKKMEAWGENFGESIGKAFENWGEGFGKDMEAWGEDFGNKMEKWAEEHEGENGRDGIHFDFDTDSKRSNRNVKRTIIVKMPKKAELDLNVRYGKVKMAAVYNPKANISHGSLAATSIEGANTAIDVSYSPVAVGIWNGGSLTASHVKDCNIATAGDIAITSNSSDVYINNLNGSGMISGSFGKLSIPNVSDDFGALTIILENSDLALKLPTAAFNFSYSGEHNDFILPRQLETKSIQNGKTQMVNGFHKTRSTGNVITITAKFSEVVLN
jgi:hypothetical protein